MTLLEGISQFTLLDGVAAALLIAAWLGIGWRVDHPGAAQQSVSSLMAEYRRMWMHNHLTRDPRVFDALVLTNLRQGTTFFASGCMIVIGGAMALIGNPEPLVGVAEDLAIGETKTAVLELKLIVLILLLAKAFFNFVWSHRVFGYCAVMMGAIPNESETALARGRAKQAAELNISAARSFNGGLRTVYFALASLAWFLGAIPLICAVIATFLIVWRREFSSHSRRVLLMGAEDETSPDLRDDRNTGKPSLGG